LATLFLTISIARSTPAQNPLGAASKILVFYYSFFSRIYNYY